MGEIATSINQKRSLRQLPQEQAFWDDSTYSASNSRICRKPEKTKINQTEQKISNITIESNENRHYRQTHFTIKLFLGGWPPLLKTMLSFINDFDHSISHREKKAVHVKALRPTRKSFVPKGVVRP